MDFSIASLAATHWGSNWVHGTSVLRQELSEELQKLKNGEINVAVVPARPSRSWALAADMEYQNRLTLRNKFFSVASSPRLEVVRIHPRRDVAWDCRGEANTEVRVSRLPALPPQACSDDPQVL